MASNYTGITEANREEYGAGIGRWGKDVLAIRYDDRTHFIFELLQNAEDAFGRRADWIGSRSIRFHLTDDALRVSHFGVPFSEEDVRGICGIAESTKDLTAIGRFGIGFKSVYAFTDRPEVHSGGENFAIENFVWPVGTVAIDRDPDETVIILPLRKEDGGDREEIVDGLKRLGPRTLLFLRQIEEIAWETDDGQSGVYIRSKPEKLDENVRRITVIGQQKDEREIEQTWLVFSRPAQRDGNAIAGYVEVAFLLERDEDRSNAVVPVKNSPLVAFFPTVLETHLGFLVQGPYRTTPSRDNVPRSDLWNQGLVHHTSEVLVGALRWLRDNELLDTRAISCFPLDPDSFDETSMFRPLYVKTRQAFMDEALLPRYDHGYVSAKGARIGRTQELRALFSASQLAEVYGEEEVAWLSGDISVIQTSELREYLMRELGVAEVTPESIIPQLSKEFLEAQSDEWVLRLYEFLSSQSALRRRIRALPLIRLESGVHVNVTENGKLQAFLPSEIKTDFPTVHPSVCASDESLEFLRSLGLTTPDPVDDVIRNLLPKYTQDEVDVSDDEYSADIKRILSAFGTDSKTQRDKLISGLRDTPFVMAVDTGNSSPFVVTPSDVYLATDRLKELFAGVPNVLLVDDRYESLRGQRIRDLLEACGAMRHLRPVRDWTLSSEERRELRERAEHPETSGRNDRVHDNSLHGLDELLETLGQLEGMAQRSRARLLWEELALIEERRGKGVFSGQYTWTHYGEYRRTFDAAFVRILNRTAWVPDGAGELQRPEFVPFDTLGWNRDPFLQSKISFKPPVLDSLAREAGIEPGALDLLKKLGLTSAEQLRERLGIDASAEQTNDAPDAEDSTAEEAARVAPENQPGQMPPVEDSTITGNRESVSFSDHSGSDGESGSAGRSRGTVEKDGNVASPSGRSTFVSYIGVHPEGASDEGSTDYRERIELEERAISLILAKEPNLRRTPTNNPGFDLYRSGSDGQPRKWVEVKAMADELKNRPVGLTQTQFRYAQEHKGAYWLYIVENADKTGRERILRIQDPAGWSSTFTFDHGWLRIADGVGDDQGASGHRRDIATD